MFRIELSQILGHHSCTPWSRGDYSVMRLEEHIQRLCAQAIAETDPEKLALVLAELKAALREHQLEASNLLFLHRKLFNDVV
jgi:hypothetical protein